MFATFRSCVTSMPDMQDRIASALARRYRVIREIGHGGMATVYLAEDLQNARKVAIKVLRPEIAGMMGGSRFLEEIQTTANLQHPHILPLFDSGVVVASGTGESTTLYYVMPFVEGESLRDRLDRERQLPVADAIRIAREVGGALDYAHRRGIVHRDIKPENILLQDDRALVADFGIARAMRHAGGTRLTATGTSLGTPRYMSPEQATADREVDARTDVYALGAVTYEMLVGEPPLTGTSAQAIFARLMIETPRPISAHRKAVPESIDAAVARALEKLPADRWRTAADFVDALSVGTAHPLSKRAMGWPVLAGALGIALVASLAVRGRPGGSISTAVRGTTARAAMSLGPNVQLAIDGAPIDISADGSTIVYAGDHGGTSQLYLRPVDSFEGRPLAGTEGATLPFLSPDGRWIGFFAGGQLKKVARVGGETSVLADVDGTPAGGSWGDDGTIVFSMGTQSLFSIADTGGRSTRIAARAVTGDSVSGGPAGAFASVRWPQLLPDRRHALVATDVGIAVMGLETGELRHLVRASFSRARYLMSGHIAFDEAEGRIRVVPFDVRRLAVTGAATPAFEAFHGPSGEAAAQFAVSNTGTLVYMAGGFNRSLVLVDRFGRETSVSLPARGYRFPRFSPDGRWLAITIDPRPSSIWVAELARGTLSRLTGDGHSIGAQWSRDGGRLAFWEGAGVQWVQWPALGSSQALLSKGAPSTSDAWPKDWAPDGRVILTYAPGTMRDLFSAAPGDSSMHTLIATSTVEDNPAVSPDGRWLAYNSNATGVAEIYVQPYPSGGARTMVSTHGGIEPRWSRNGRTLYYRDRNRIMAVTVTTGAAFEAGGSPRLVFSGEYDFSQDGNWDVGPDETFVLVKGDPATRGRLLMVVNWFDELRRGATPNADASPAR